ncbi:hypothetical protein, partial [Microseira sp. BLCC-F43]|uniref:hypothetical protein n=1 Tax=Microseira sp. BLCC-F43 TaxID=3153602 RepID=UPI0035BAD968
MFALLFPSSNTVKEMAIALADIGVSLQVVTHAIAISFKSIVVRCLTLLAGFSLKKGYWLIPTTSASRVIKTDSAQIYCFILLLMHP